MALSRIAFVGLLAGVGVLRLVELNLSRRHQRLLRNRAAPYVPDPHFPEMVALHTGILVGAAVEVVAWRRPLLPPLAITMAVLFAAANALRWSAVRTLGAHWNVQVFDSTSLGIVIGGPYRYIRHPNYAAVFVELLALPLIHTAWVTAVIGAVAHGRILLKRITLEERVLFRSDAYARSMGDKPRFVPRLR